MAWQRGTVGQRFAVNVCFNVSRKATFKVSMSTSLPVVEKAESEGPADEMELHLDVQNVSKKYHLWESPRTRLIYGAWSQVPRWAPPRLRKIAQKEKTRLGRDFYALQNVSLQLRRGESVAILGRNGSGKSTLLQIICGILQPSTGTVARHCQRVAALLELGSGFNPEFTGRENVFLNGTVLGLRKEEIEARFSQIVEFAEIGQFIDQPVKTYSSGMMVRLAFAVQVQLDPDLLIVDEALAVGDVFFQQKCFAYMRRLKERGCSFLIVGHDTRTLQQFCDRGIVLVEGRKHFEGVSRDAIREYYLTVSSRHNAPVDASEGELAEKTLNEGSKLEEPEHWLEPREASSDRNAPAKLIRWSCANEAGKVVDQFFPGQKIRLFAEFECMVPVREASVGFGIRDKTGQVVHGKHQYQIDLGKKINSDVSFLLRCEFAFDCRLAIGEYTVEFGLLDIGRRSAQLSDSRTHIDFEEFFEILCHPPPVGRFAVIPRRIDPIKRNDHFGIVDIDVRTNFSTTVSKRSESNDAAMVLPPNPKHN
jgi:lipopolysaccharide transport system ATP-binding protein